MAISFSRPDPSSPAAVGAAQFTVGRRGFEQEEVRDFLRMVSAELARLQERERFLESELRTLQTNGVSSPGVLDEETVMRVLGEETARVLTAAREAAQQMRLRASESADRIVREATADATRIRNDAEIEVSRQRADAIADAEAEIELAKQQGREMVAEARAYREKVLSELSRRRELAREQIEHLIHHRDRLATAFERARLAATDVVGDLDEFDELADEIEKSAGLMSSTTAPTFVDHTADPDAIPQRNVGVDQVEEDQIGEADETSSSSLVSNDISNARESLEVSRNEEAIQETQADEPSVETSGSLAKAEHPSNEQPNGHMAEVVHLFGAKKPEVEPEANEVQVDELLAPTTTKPDDTKPSISREVDKTSVDEIFARLRESRVDALAQVIREPKISRDLEEHAPLDVREKSKVVSPQIDPKLFALRDEALSQANLSISRKVKRVLADLENSALTLLQSKKYILTLETLLPSVETVKEELVQAISSEAMNVALAGAQAVTGGLKADLRKKVTSSEVMESVSSLIVDSIIDPLRSRLERSIDQCDRDVKEMATLTKSIFRELRLQRLEPVISDLTLLAYNKGSFHALPVGTKICWMVDPNGPNCSDAEDNALAGPCSLGEPFPTGHLHPTCHTGCRCLIGPAK